MHQRSGPPPCRRAAAHARLEAVPDKPAKSVNPLRVLALWLLYAFVGFILLLAMLAAGDVGPGPSDDSPTRWPAKIVGALSGIAIVFAGLGGWVRSDPNGNFEFATLALTVGSALGAVLSVACWVLITRDLRSRR